MENALPIIAIITALIAVIVAAAVAYGLGTSAQIKKAAAEIKAVHEDTSRMLEEAQNKNKEQLLEAKDESLKVRAQIEAEHRERRAEVQRQERRLQQKEENLDRKIETLERRERTIQTREKEQEAIRAELDNSKKEQIKELERIAQLSIPEARELLLKSIEDEVREDASRRIRQIELEAREEGERRARDIMSMAIQRYASEQVAETTVSVVPLPNDEMKGRIIGREGRNIRALEQATGVDLIVDDTPEAVILSCFDTVRREIARVALTKLIFDGRIQPGRIEEVVAKAKLEVEETIKEEGEQACYKLGIHGMHPELIRLLGRLRYRTSYGQNVLANSIETANLGAMIAAEMGADVKLVKRAGLLHDVGKAADHEVEGPHATIGADLAKRYGESPKVVLAIASHHNEADAPQSLEAIIVQAADAISGARPGARRETLESYVKRLEALEGIANSFTGVEKSFAIQAGREIRILVKPEEIDDLAAIRLARDIAKKVEENLEYPGQIRVTVVREMRAVDYAK
jgi:ribonucrease Y